MRPAPAFHVQVALVHDRDISVDDGALPRAARRFIGIYADKRARLSESGTSPSVRARRIEPGLYVPCPAYGSIDAFRCVVLDAVDRAAHLERFHEFRVVGGLIGDIERHDLWKLWKECRAVVETGGSDDDAADAVEQVTKDFHDLDKNASAFRHARDKNGKVFAWPGWSISKISAT